MFNERLNYIQDKLFNIFIVFSYVIIFISFFGFSDSAPQYLENVDYYFRIYICLFLIWRFNPFRKIDKFTDLDRKIAFNAGLFILTTTALNKYLLEAQEKVKKIVMPNQQ
jgi:hypothetical protein